MAAMLNAVPLPPLATPPRSGPSPPGPGERDRSNSLDSLDGLTGFAKYVFHPTAVRSIVELTHYVIVHGESQMIQKATTRTKAMTTLKEATVLRGHLRWL
jgi:hypothetical protein